LPESKREDYVKYIKKILSIKKANSDYLISRVNKFVKAREYEKAAINFAEDVSKGKFEKAERTILSAMKTGIEREDIGSDYFRDFSDLDNRFEKEKPLVTTCFTALDKLILGFKRQEFVIIMGKFKGKKSWYLYEIARHGLMKGLNVLIISHENSIAEIRKRMDMISGALLDENTCKNGEEGKKIKLFYYDEEEERIKNEKVYRESVFNSQAVKKTRKTLERFGGRLLIKKYPPRVANMFEVMRYLDHIEKFEKFIPDIVINDYITIMSPLEGDERKPLHESERNNGLLHKTIADDRNCLVITASQINREEVNKPVPTVKGFAGAIAKAGDCDKTIVICQTDEQEKLFPIQEGKLFVLLNRTGSGQHQHCIFGSNLMIGQFALYSRLERGRKR